MVLQEFSPLKAAFFLIQYKRKCEGWLRDLNIISLAIKFVMTNIVKVEFTLLTWKLIIKSSLLKVKSSSFSPLHIRVFDDPRGGWEKGRWTNIPFSKPIDDPLRCIDADLGHFPPYHGQCIMDVFHGQKRQSRDASAQNLWRFIDMEN